MLCSHTRIVFGASAERPCGLSMKPKPAQSWRTPSISGYMGRLRRGLRLSTARGMRSSYKPILLFSNFQKPFEMCDILKMAFCGLSCFVVPKRPRSPQIVPAKAVEKLLGNCGYKKSAVFRALCLFMCDSLTPAPRCQPPPAVPPTTAGALPPAG